MGLECKINRLNNERVNKASDLPIIHRGSKEWKDAVSALKKDGRGDVRVANVQDAKALLKEAKGNMNRVHRYKSLDKIKNKAQMKKRYEMHKLDIYNIGKETMAGNDLDHYKWNDGKNSGHIFFN